MNKYWRDADVQASVADLHEQRPDVEKILGVGVAPGREAQVQRIDNASLDRARSYLRKLPPSIQRCNGSGAAMTAARALRWGFCFDEATAFSIFMSDFNG